ncbi:MAG: GNAT family N-acetyltransferase [Oscillospiraceae bacterium]|nr:GNAT family N-acetyltransferase [Oscillospiraceae bacterium]
MICLRPFTENDAIIIQQSQYPDISISDIEKMIAEWNTKTCQSKYFEIFAITADNKIVGSVSLYEHSRSVASIGVEVYPDERRKRYASEGMRLIMNYARELGYRIIQDQVRTDNQPSIAVHNSLGFETDGYVYQNAKGKDILLYLFCL